jgi:hypothetical protein
LQLTTEWYRQNQVYVRLHYKDRESSI